MSIFLSALIQHNAEVLSVLEQQILIIRVWSTGSTTPFITVNQTGNYTITATSIAGNCSVKDEIVVTINSIPNAYLGNDTTVCGHIILDGETGSAFNYTCAGWNNITSVHCN
ncbi:MAG: hypothetical protein IPG39_18350 [Bacteroidetes bacterium]|nr:hypothetical protein [Bacteroidota bacterium]